MRTNRNFIVAFSGACHSGKTETIKTIVESFNNDYSVVGVVNERLRKELISDMTIDTIRSNPREYLQLQIKIITDKIEVETALLTDSQFNDKIILIDRSIIDSLYYLTNCLDRVQLLEIDMYNLHLLIKKVLHHADFAFKHIYNYVYFFEPIPVEKPFNDRFKPQYIEVNQFIERNMIELMTKPYLGFNAEVFNVDLNTTNYDFKEHILQAALHTGAFHSSLRGAGTVLEEQYLSGGGLSDSPDKVINCELDRENLIKCKTDI